MALYSTSDCHPKRAATRYTLRCDRCAAEHQGALAGYATDAAMRRQAAGQGWTRVAVVAASGKRAHKDACPACQRQAGLPRPRATGRTTPR